MTNSSIPQAVPSAVAPATGHDTIPILDKPQLQPYQPPTTNFSSLVKQVPRAQGDNPAEVTPQRGWAGRGSSSTQLNNGGGAPSVPVSGYLYTQGPIDQHYTSPVQAVNPNGNLPTPYGKVNNPPTRGMFTRVQSFVNHIAQAPQDVDPNGFRISPPQQRTSVMLNTLPPHGNGYSPETFQPRQLPQRPNTSKFLPALGTQKYGTGVLNRDTFGAGQTAGGIGGNNYTPQPGPPDTTSTAGTGTVSAEPTWG